MKHDQVSERGVTSAHRTQEEDEEEVKEEEKRESLSLSLSSLARLPFSYASLI